MGSWWWKADPQTPVLKASDPIPDPQPTASNPPASPRELIDKPFVTPESEESQRTKPRRTNLLGLDESAEDELARALSSQFKSLPTSTPSTSAEARQPESRQDVDYETSLYPTAMSCRQAFDAWFHCKSVGGQLGSVYRYGELNSCENKWSDFWFCMRMKNVSGFEKENTIRDHYRKRDVEKYGAWKDGRYLGPWEKLESDSAEVQGRVTRKVDGEVQGRKLSSEEVWEKRVEPIKSGEMFRWDPDEPEEKWSSDRRRYLDIIAKEWEEAARKTGALGRK